MANDQSNIKELINALNEAWPNEDYDEVREMLDEEVVFVNPDYSMEVTGRDHCADTFRQFMETASLNQVEVSEPNVHVWDNTAIGHYEFSIQYELDGEVHEEQGTDILVFVKRDEGWKIVWRGLGNIAEEEDQDISMN